MHDVQKTLRMPAGSIDVRSALRSGTLWLETAGPLDGQWFRVALRVEPPVYFAEACRSGTDELEEDVSPAPHWAMAAPTHGNAPPEDVFARVIAHAEENVRDVAAAFELPWRGYGIALVELRNLVRESARRALAACEPAALAIARRFHPDARWFVYGTLVGDVTGRIAQLASSCPGALVLASALHRRRHPEGADAIVREAIRGAPLRAVVARGVDAWLELRRRDDLEREWPRACAGPEEYARRQALLVRRAGPQVDPEHLLSRPALGFAPEDVPARADLNAAWFRAMAGAARALARAESPGIEIGAFVSRSFRALLSTARRLQPTYDLDEGPGDGVQRAAEQLVAYCLRTGRRPGRRSSPVGIFAETKRWARRALDPESPEGRLGALLGRVRKLELGEVVSVCGFGARTNWEAIQDLALPAWPHEDVRVRGVEVEHLGTAAALAREGEAMRHCVATVLSHLMAGHLHVFSVRAGPSRLTLALAPRLLGGYEVAELRGANDRSPLPAEAAAVARWVEAVNARVRSTVGSSAIGDGG